MHGESILSVEMVLISSSGQQSNGAMSIWLDDGDLAALYFTFYSIAAVNLAELFSTLPFCLVGWSDTMVRSTYGVERINSGTIVREQRLTWVQHFLS